MGENRSEALVNYLNWSNLRAQESPSRDATRRANRSRLRFPPRRSVCLLIATANALRSGRGPVASVGEAGDRRIGSAAAARRATAPPLLSL